MDYGASNTEATGPDMAGRRVLFVTRKWPPAVGGMELYSREIARAMARLASVDVIALPGLPDGRPPSMPKLAAFLLRTTA